MYYGRKVQLKLPLKTQNRPKKELLLLPKKTLLPSCALLIAACALSTTSTPTSAMISSSYVMATTAVDFPLSLNETRFCVVVFFYFDVFLLLLLGGGRGGKSPSRAFWVYISIFIRLSPLLLWTVEEEKCTTKTKPPPPGFQTFRGRFNPPCVLRESGSIRHDANAKTVILNSFSIPHFLPPSPSR